METFRLTDEEIEDIRFALERCADDDEALARTEGVAGTDPERALRNQVVRFRRLAEKITA